MALSSRSQDIFDANFLIFFSSDVESLKKGIVKTSMNKANKSYTILLVGETGVGKSSVLEFIANVLAGNDINHYNFNILDQTNERGGSNNQSQTNSTRLYELMSNNGMTVCPAFVNVIITPNLFPRSVSSIRLGWPTLTVSRKTSSTRRVLLLRSKVTPTPSRRF